MIRERPEDGTPKLRTGHLGRAAAMLNGIHIGRKRLSNKGLFSQRCVHHNRKDSMGSTSRLSQSRVRAVMGASGTAEGTHSGRLETVIWAPARGTGSGIRIADSS